MSITRPGLASMSPAIKPIVGALLLAFGAAGAQAQSLTEVVQAARGVDATYLGARANADGSFTRTSLFDLDAPRLVGFPEPARFHF